MCFRPKVSSPPRRKQIQFPKRCVFYSLEYGTKEKVQKPINSKNNAIIKNSFNVSIMLSLPYQLLLQPTGSGSAGISRRQ
jgi:hypothetical protein